MTDAEKDEMVRRFLACQQSEHLTEQEKKILDSAMSDFTTEMERISSMVTEFYSRHIQQTMEQ